MLTPIGESVRRADPDRFFTALFAPPERRETLLLLYAFNHELARAREVASDPTIALIRLQWWREVVDGADRRHEIAAPLAAAIAAGQLHADELMAMIDGREAEAEPYLADTHAWLAYLGNTAGALAVAAGRLLGADEAQRSMLRDLGASYGAAGVLRGIPALARQQRCLLPADVLASHGLSPEAITSAPQSARLRPVVSAIAAIGLGLARSGCREALPRSCVAAALPATLGLRDLRRARTGQASAAPRGLSDRLAVLTAAAIGRP